MYSMKLGFIISRLRHFIDYQTINHSQGRRPSCYEVLIHKFQGTQTNHRQDEKVVSHHLVVIPQILPKDFHLKLKSI